MECIGVVGGCGAGGGGYVLGGDVSGGGGAGEDEELARAGRWVVSFS